VASGALTVVLHLRRLVVPLWPDEDLVALAGVRQRVRMLRVQLWGREVSEAAPPALIASQRALELVHQDGLQRAHLLRLLVRIVCERGGEGRAGLAESASRTRHG